MATDAALDAVAVHALTAAPLPTEPDLIGRERYLVAVKALLPPGVILTLDDGAAPADPVHLPLTLDAGGVEEHASEVTYRLRGPVTVPHRSTRLTQVTVSCFAVWSVQGVGPWVDKAGALAATVWRDQAHHRLRVLMELYDTAALLLQSAEEADPARLDTHYLQEARRHLVALASSCPLLTHDQRQVATALAPEWAGTATQLLDTVAVLTDTPVRTAPKISHSDD